MKHLGQAASQLELQQRLSALQPATLPLWGKMNTVQMLGHLRESLRIILKERPAARVWNPLRGPLGRYLVLYAPLPWPHGAPTLPEVDMVRFPSPQQDFAHTRIELEERMERFCTAAPTDLLEAHPMLGNMSQRDWLHWGYRHTDHHLRQFGC